MEMPPYQTLATLARDVDPFAVVEHLQALGSPREVAAAYDQLLRDAYWQHKDLPLILILANGGIHYCITHARLAETDEQRAEFKSSAKTLAGNLASFTWPGWDEQGITISAAAQARGYDAARLNLRLALELQKPFDKICAASWLMGAHLLAMRQLEEAMFYFRYAAPDPDHPDAPLYAGYVLLTQFLEHEPDAADLWSAHLAKLTTLADDHSIFIRDQLVTAYRVFARKFAEI